MARKKLEAVPASPAREVALRPTEVVDVATLVPHPKNYRAHPDAQLAHIDESLLQHGVYRNIVVARDGTILAGHGVVQSATRLGVKRLPVIRLDIAADSPQAMKVLAADNELGKFAENDDRLLSEILKRIRDEDESALLGTGYDDKALAALVMVTRPASEIRSNDEAAEWVGMPEYDEGGTPIRLVITFADIDARTRFIEKAKMKIVKQVGDTWSARWPTVENEDVHSLKFKAKKK